MNRKPELTEKDIVTLMDNNNSLLRLLHLVSPTLPTGAFSYSQGLEWTVEAGWVTDRSAIRTFPLIVQNWWSDGNSRDLTDFIRVKTGHPLRPDPFIQSIHQQDQQVITCSPLVARLLGISRVRLPEVSAIYDTDNVTSGDT